MSSRDRRRVLPPSDTQFPSVEFVKPQIIAEEERMGDNEIRNMFLKTGFVQNTNGSAYLEVGKTIIEVSVYGPRPIHGSFVDRASFSVETKFAPYIQQPHFGSQDNKKTNIGYSDLENKISNYVEVSLLPSILLKKYPKSTIDLFINIISTDGNTSLTNLISWVVNCASVALLDAAIELKDIVSSGQLSFDIENKEVLLDSTKTGVGIIECVVSFMNLRENEISGILIEGTRVNLDAQLIDKLVDKCMEMSQRIRSNINYFLLNEAN